MTWWAYVQQHAGHEKQNAVGKKVGISGASIGRWEASAPKPQHVAAFARAYGRPVLEAFIAAGYLTAEEAGEKPSAPPSLTDMADDELLTEVARRMRGGQPDAGQAEAQKSPGVVPGLDGLRRVDYLRAAAEGESSKDHDDDGE